MNEMDVYNNLAALAKNPYPGRIIVTGLNETGTHIVQVYAISGRSGNSRNRVFSAVEKLGRVATEAADPSKVEDPSLIIYDAMLEEGSRFVVSNGNQTNTVINAPSNLSLHEALLGRTFEPDAPNFTSRITALYTRDGDKPHVQLSILRKSLFGDGCERSLFDYPALPGLGYYIATYVGDAPSGGTLPPFMEAPLLMPIEGSIEQIAERYWGALNDANRVSLVVKFINIDKGPSQVHIVNKYQKVA